MTKVKAEKMRKMGVKPVSSLSGVRGIVAYLPILRRIQRFYNIGHTTTYIMCLMACSGSIGVTRLCVLYYGYKSGPNYRYTQYWLDRLKCVGLAYSVGGKWRLTKLGLQELGLIEAGCDADDAIISDF